MPGESILIVDDTPVNLKLTRILLQHEGYEVRTAASAEEALTVLESFHPRLVLADIQLPGMDGLEMTRRIKDDARNQDVLVVALTAFAMKGDEEKAIEAGCDGYITKPIDTRTLGGRVRGYLNGGVGQARPAPGGPTLLPEDEMAELRRRFLDEGLELIQCWIRDLDGQFDAPAAGGVAHQWVGSGGLLGFQEISAMSRDVELTLRETPLDTAELRDLLESLLEEFINPRISATPVPPPRPAPVSGRRSRVLIADDDPNMLALLKAIVQSQSIECQTVSDGLAALAAIQACTPDAVVLDVNMPGMSGYEVMQAIRAESLPVKVMLLTADERPATCSADDYMIKPFNPIELVARLKRLTG
jgi:two-component system cell cycle response regulator DivK